MYTNDRETYRRTYYEAWQKHKKRVPLEPIEMQLIQVMLQHPEYHGLLEKGDVTEQFELGENPFFHMSLHLAIQDQIQTNRPAGVLKVYQELLEQHPAAHDVEHLMMQCLAQTILQAQQSGSMPDEITYLQNLRVIIKTNS